MFPVPGKGLVWDEGDSRLGLRCPAAVGLGRRMPSTIDAKGRSRSLLRCTLYSLQDRRAETATNEGKHTEAHVLV